MALFLQVFGWIIEVLETREVKLRKICKPAHLCWKCLDSLITTEVEQVKCREGANAQRHTLEQIVGQIKGADHWSNNIKWQIVELIIREIENCEARGPLCSIWDFFKCVVGEIKFS